MRLWLLAAVHKSWPSEPLYLNALAAEPCGRTVPRGIIAVLSFFETRGGTPQGHLLSEATAVVDPGAVAQQRGFTHQERPESSSFR
eukprot:5068136-Amphidinium_carterae.1